MPELVVRGGGYLGSAMRRRPIGRWRRRRALCSFPRRASGQQKQGHSSREPQALIFISLSSHLQQGSCSSPEMASDAGKSNFLATLPKKVPVDFMREITGGFAPQRKIGQGNFGTVYQGILTDGTLVAVKKIGENSTVTPDKQFTNEVGNLMAIRHDNIVKLLSFCHETQKKVVEHNGRYILADTIESLLCYEYVPKGSLEKYVFAESNRIDWDTSFKIIKGICQGLHFLHKGMDTIVIHMDLKPDNILLDENFVPKIADFGLSRLFGQDQTRMVTQNVVGAHGYIAPEYLYRGEISAQTDIYSLGILILEITTRETNFRSKDDMSSRKYVENASKIWTPEHITSVYRYLRSDQLQEVRVCIEIALKCVEIDRRNRPSIEDIVMTLNGRRAS